MDERPYNPLDKINLGASVAAAMLESEARPLGNLTPFNGAGVYAIYYVGDLAPYEPLAALNRDGKFLIPIYVGKAVPSGARKGTFGLDVNPDQALYKRLREHAESVKSAKNLCLEDFYCRYLIVDDIWIPLGESLLIAKFSPVWNKIIDGFGNHDPGARRYDGKRPKWDTLHPGRKWAEKLAPREESPERIAEEVADYLRVELERGL